MKKIIYFIGVYNVCIWLHNMGMGLIKATKDPEAFGRQVGKTTNDIIEKYGKGFDDGVKESEKKAEKRTMGFHV